MLLEEDTDCFCFLAGHESFAAAEGAIGICLLYTSWLEKTRCGALENETDRSETIINESELATREDIVFDPQTSGGLLLSIDSQDARCV